ncbi:hypothetical protein VMCG_03791 [Cytospora schulzeri]|uniref:Uncharacterized protein n=1 Tax=Cytospora schulzeri TaxID=448051 RepID=A0A423WVA0_9PEZI|nr:hypothetical protein VMCG_03791 [Valsa malicola]
MLRSIARNTVRKNVVSTQSLAAFQIRTMAGAKNRVEDAAQAAGEAKKTSPKNPSVISSEGAVGKQFNPDGNIGQVGEKIGGAFSKDGAIGSQFDASKDGIAGNVEKAVDGPARPATEKK